MHTRAGVQHAAKTEVRHTSSRETRWGGLAQGSHASPPMRHVRGDVRRSRRRPRRSGGGPGEGCLADTGRCHGRWVCRTFQRLEDLPDDLPVRHGRDYPQRPPLTPGAARHSERKHALEPSRPGPARGPGVRRLLVYALLSWRGDDRSTQVAVGRQTAARAHQVDSRAGRIGISKGIFAPPPRERAPRRQRPGARRRATRRGLDMPLRRGEG